MTTKRRRKAPATSETGIVIMRESSAQLKTVSPVFGWGPMRHPGRRLVGAG